MIVLALVCFVNSVAVSFHWSVSHYLLFSFVLCVYIVFTFLFMRLCSFVLWVWLELMVVDCLLDVLYCILL